MKFIAHRGDRGAGRENSLVAFRAAAANPRVDMIELDVRCIERAGQKKWVVFHDLTLTRLYGRTGIGMRWIWDLSEEELAKLEIPLLEPVLAEFAPQVELYLDLKGKMTRDELAELLRLVAPYGKQVALAAFDRKKIHNLLDLGGVDTRIAWITDNDINWGDSDSGSGSGDGAMVKRLDFLAMGADQLTCEDLQRIQALGVSVFTYTLNDQLLWHKYREMGVDGILTDFPSLPEN